MKKKLAIFLIIISLLIDNNGVLANKNQKYLKKIKSGYQELNQGQIDKASHIFENLIATNPGSYEPHLGLAKVYLETNDYVKAQKELELAIKDNPKCSEAIYDLGNIYESNQEWQKAVNEFEMYLQLEPEKSREKYIALRIKYLKDNLAKKQEEK